MRTPTGDPIKWNRRGSMSMNGVHGMIDVYDIYLMSGAEYRTIYINMYGAKNSTMAPRGFTLNKAEPAKKNKSNFVNVFKVDKGTLSKWEKFLKFSIITTIILSSISILCVILAMIFQDSLRSINENWDPTIVYAILLIVIGTLLVFSIRSLKTKQTNILFLVSLITFVVVCIVVTEGSVQSRTFYRPYANRYVWYDNYELIEGLNLGWVLGTIFSFSICLLPVLIAVARIITKKIITKWHGSITYRERCYKRVEKMHTYLEKGIISQEEYERTKEDILKNTTNISE